MHSAFEHGAIDASPRTSAHAVRGRIFETWRDLGLEASHLGYPTSDEYEVSEGRRSDFEHGSIVWVAAHDEIRVE
ncbi:MAG TPA: hypothetical protein VM925_13735 [Labilithrix sp.]|jgi:uncharacterized protein with LGFP repeats|nr:hypothetical protein [Labilithrix sp.]